MEKLAAVGNSINIWHNAKQEATNMNRKSWGKKDISELKPESLCSPVRRTIQVQTCANNNTSDVQDWQGTDFM